LTQKSNKSDRHSGWSGQLVIRFFAQFAVKGVIKAGLNQFADEIEGFLFNVDYPATHSTVDFMLVPFSLKNSRPLGSYRFFWNQL
jgi:hypothetical protein